MSRKFEEMHAKPEHVRVALHAITNMNGEYIGAPMVVVNGWLESQPQGSWENMENKWHVVSLPGPKNPYGFQGAPSNSVELSSV